MQREAGPRKAEAPGTEAVWKAGGTSVPAEHGGRCWQRLPLSGLESESQEDHLVTALCHPLIRNGPLGLPKLRSQTFPTCASYCFLWETLISP